MDTTRVDHIGAFAYDEIETPNLDALAAEGVLFELAVSPVPITLASHSTMFTGLSPNHHGVRENGTFKLGKDKQTLAEVLKEEGYATGAFVGTFTLDSRFGLAQGFDVYDDDLAAGNKGRRRSWSTWQGHMRPYGDRPANTVVEPAIAWLEEQNEGPFFLWVHLFDPHQPYEPPQPFLDRYPGRPYDGEIAFADSEIGRLFARLRSLGLAERTLVVFAADHGESLGEHGYTGHGMRLYEPAVRVPLIASFPGRLRQGRRVKELVRLVDLMPTVLSLLQIDVDRPFDGVDLTDRIEGRGGEEPRLAMPKHASRCCVSAKMSCDLFGRGDGSTFATSMRKATQHKKSFSISRKILES